MDLGYHSQAMEQAVQQSLGVLRDSSETGLDALTR
jgi:hypothetical protein